MSKVLIVYWWPAELEMRVAVQQHLHALDRGGDEIVYVNAHRPPPRWIRLVDFDAVILHTTFLCVRWDPAFERYRRAFSWLRRVRCPIIALPQDEYDHAAVLDEWLSELGVAHVLSNFDAATRSAIYPQIDGKAQFGTALTGYIDETAAAYCREHAVPAAERPYDIVYRAQQLPYWFGSHGQLKHQVGLAVAARAPSHALRCDISTRPEDTIYGPSWLDFVMSGRAIVGAESGSSVLDRRGEIQARIRALVTANPTLTFTEVKALMPAGWDSYAFFAISPRHLEAVIARTAQVLVKGAYSGVLEPDRHYIPVRRDLSDLDDALDRVRDADLVDELTSTAYDEVYLSRRWTTDRFADDLRSLFPALRTRPRRYLGDAAAPAVRSLEELAQPVVSAFQKGTVAVTLLRLTAIAIASLKRRPELARLLIRDWARVRPRPLARDLVRLGALDRFVQHQRLASGPWRVVVAEEEGVLVLRTCLDRDGTGTTTAVHRADRVIWDHSRAAATVPLDSGTPDAYVLALGADGVYEFAALTGLLRRHPSLPWAATLAPRG